MSYSLPLVLRLPPTPHTPVQEPPLSRLPTPPVVLPIPPVRGWRPEPVPGPGITSRRVSGRLHRLRFRKGRDAPHHHHQRCEDRCRNQPTDASHRRYLLCLAIRLSRIAFRLYYRDDIREPRRPPPPKGGFGSSESTRTTNQESGEYLELSSMSFREDLLADCPKRGC